LIVISIGALLVAKPARAETFTVNSTGDGGDAAPRGVCNTTPFPVGTEPECTLRAAIDEANDETNNPGEDTINFDIGGSGVKTIAPASGLPTITDPVTINGYTERPCSTNPAPCSKPNTDLVGTNAVLRVQLNGANAGSSMGLHIAAPNSVVKGLAINRFGGAGIEVDGAENVRIEGNFIGTNPAGTQDLGNAGAGVLTSGSATTVGGTSRAARNIISGNGANGFATSDLDSRVLGNLVGTDRTGTEPLGNGGNGVRCYSNGTIGGTTAASANVIAFNAEDGVAVSHPIVSDIDGNTIRRNSIFSNGEQGIDLGDDGRTPNDGAGDADDGPNTLQNFPLLASARTVGDTTTIKARLTSRPGRVFVVRFFSNPPNTDEGKTFMGQKSVATDAGGDTGPFSFTPQLRVPAGRSISATATDPDANTSEFSVPRAVSSP
jgi:CSLREA domain-containing protein